MIDQRFFRVVIDYPSIKIFTSMLFLLQKIGKELYIEVEPNNLTFRTLNDSKSAFLAIELHENFFGEYDLETTNRDSFACKSLLKPIVLMLKNTKNVRNICLEGHRIQGNYELILELLLTNGIIRRHRFGYMDCEIVNAVFHEEECSFLQSKAKVMSQILDHLHRTQEIMMSTTVNSFSVKSFHSPELLMKEFHKQIMNTGLTVNIQEFDAYDYRSESEGEYLVLSVKEFMAFLAFCETIGLSTFDMFYSSGGRAIKFKAQENGVHASLIQATIDHRPDEMIRTEQSFVDRAELPRTDEKQRRQSVGGAQATTTSSSSGHKPTMRKIFPDEDDDEKEEEDEHDDEYGQELDEEDLGMRTEEDDDDSEPRDYQHSSFAQRIHISKPVFRNPNNRLPAEEEAEWEDQDFMTKTMNPLEEEMTEADEEEEEFSLNTKKHLRIPPHPSLLTGPSQSSIIPPANTQTSLDSLQQSALILDSIRSSASKVSKGISYEDQREEQRDEQGFGVSNHTFPPPHQPTTTSVYSSNLLVSSKNSRKRLFEDSYEENEENTDED